jgi:hypothetical protein
VPAVLSLLWLASLALPGVAALARFAPFLTPLERLAHGAVLGVVAGTLLLIPLAIVGGLTPLVIAATGLVALAVGAALWLVPGPAGDATPVGERIREPSRWLAAGGIPGFLGRLDPWATALFAALAVRWAFLWQSALDDAVDGLWAGHEYLWSDWPTHLGIVTRFAWGDNFPPVNTLFDGLPLSYHYLSDLTPAAFVTLGMAPTTALPFHSFVLSLVAGLSLWAFVRRLGIAPAIATLGTVLFLFGAGLGWITTAANLDAMKDLARTLAELPWDERAVAELHIRFFNPYIAFLMSQRAYLYGLPLAVLMLTLLVSAARRRDTRRFVLAGVVGGFLPLSHLPTLLAMAMTVPFLAIFLARRPWEDPRGRIPWAGWIAFGLVWIGVAMPQLLSQLGGGAGALSAFRFQLGWVAPPDEWWWFWLKNLGLFLPLTLIALVSRRVLAPRAFAVVLALMPIFVISNLAAFQPWDWDNHKILVYWFLGATIVVGALLVRVWRERRSLAVRFLVVVAVVSMTLSPLLENLDQLQGHMRFRMLTAEERELAAKVREVSGPDDLIVTAMQSHDPVMMLSGRQILMGYWGQLWVSGIPYQQRELDVREIYALTPAGEDLIRSYGVDFVVVPPANARPAGVVIDDAAWAARFPLATSTDQWRVYDVRAVTASSTVVASAATAPGR